MAQRKHLGLVLAFSLGALAAAALGAVRSAQAEVEPKAGYFCFEASGVQELQTKANAAARRGWRMVQGVGQPGGSLWCFEPR
jgi:hypothetical protein